MERTPRPRLLTQEARAASWSQGRSEQTRSHKAVSLPSPSPGSKHSLLPSGWLTVPTTQYRVLGIFTQFCLNQESMLCFFCFFNGVRQKPLGREPGLTRANCESYVAGRRD